MTIPKDAEGRRGTRRVQSRAAERRPSESGDTPGFQPGAMDQTVIFQGRGLIDVMREIQSI